MRRIEDIEAPEPQRRLGGRSARVRAAVLKSAFEMLLEKGFEAFTIGAVAARAGVHETSVYRRWRTRGALARDACLTFAEDVIPIPDTGALRSDLIALLSDVRGLLLSPRGQALTALIQLAEPELDVARRSFWQKRLRISRGDRASRHRARRDCPADRCADIPADLDRAALFQSSGLS